VIFDSAGNLYGTTQFGGGTDATCPNGCGTVYELTPNLQGTWDETILYQFQGRSDGAAPHASLLLDAQGNLYGTTQSGGSTNCSSGCGTVFKLTQTQLGVWEKTILHTFGGVAVSDGTLPSGPLIFDNTGDIFGTTTAGGTTTACFPDGCGTVFELRPSSGGSWQHHIIHKFGGGQGVFPDGGVILDSAGNLYGTTIAGSNLGQGVLFELSPDGRGSWTGKVLHKFHDSASRPASPLTFDAAGNIYGTTTQGGGVFQVTPFLSYSLLWHFTRPDGILPYAGVVLDAHGNLYGTTTQGGGTGLNDGIVFELTP
jgi:uncharacterized repeat protein (TIGR03803 family)